MILTAALAPIREAIAAGEFAIDMVELDAMQQSCEELAQGKVDEGDPVPKHFIASVTMYTAEFYVQRSVYSVVNELLRDANRKKLTEEFAAASLPLPPDPKLVSLAEDLADAEKPVLDDPALVRLRSDHAASTQQVANRRLTVIQDLAWALINSPAFFFNH